jgi:hypothetical protein
MTTKAQQAAQAMEDAKKLGCPPLMRGEAPIANVLADGKCEIWARILDEKEALALMQWLKANYEAAPVVKHEPAPSEPEPKRPSTNYGKKR